MKLKHMSLALALAGMVSVQAQASEAAVEAATPATPALTAAPVNAVSEDDLVALFGAEEAAKPLQLAALSDAEMRETEGAVLPLLFILGSAAVSAWSYHGISYYNTGRIGTSSGAAIAAGAGGLAAAAPMMRILGPYPNTGGFGIALARPFTTNPYNAANQFGRIDFHKNSHNSYIHFHRGRWGR